MPAKLELESLLELLDVRCFDINVAKSRHDDSTESKADSISYNLIREGFVCEREVERRMERREGGAFCPSLEGMQSVENESEVVSCDSAKSELRLPTF